MKQIAFLVILSWCCLACKSKHVYDNPHVRIETSFGDIELELFDKKAPKTAGAFLAYVDSGFYDNSNFYRVLNITNQPSDAPKTELIQGGLWKSNNAKARSLKGTPHETTLQTGILHKTGVISMARNEPGSATTEFFICMDNEPGLDYNGENMADKQGFAAFGRVVKGMDVAKMIYKESDINQQFKTPIPIFKIVRL
ncbi:peptidylprolyl isomerase [Parasediminibacterium paludis]|uniref:peptidylprolyl isomerase n=1 Tax=Parasediminibacterium paludis TaxID=908966 RepID=A0ABV8PUL1_9BACT